MSPFVALGLLLALLALAFVLYPVFRPSRDGHEERAGAGELDERRLALYRQIVEIEFDQRTGKISEADARELSDELLQRAAGMLTQAAHSEWELDAEIEREIGAVRKALADSRQPRTDGVRPR